MLVVGIWAVVEIFTDSFDSYAALTGAQRMVTVMEPCAGRVCHGTWDDAADRTVDGVVRLPGKLSDLPARPFRRGLPVTGGTAYLDGGALRYTAGLAAPWLVVAAGIEIALQLAAERRRERRRQAAVQRWQARYGPIGAGARP
jgi:hypothetical protein